MASDKKPCETCGGVPHDIKLGVPWSCPECTGTGEVDRKPNFCGIHHDPDPDCQMCQPDAPQVEPVTDFTDEWLKKHSATKYSGPCWRAFVSGDPSPDPRTTLLIEHTALAIQLIASRAEVAGLAASGLRLVDHHKYETDTLMRNLATSRAEVERLKKTVDAGAVVIDNDHRGMCELSEEVEQLKKENARWEKTFDMASEEVAKQDNQLAAADAMRDAILVRLNSIGMTASEYHPAYESVIVTIAAYDAIRKEESEALSDSSEGVCSQCDATLRGVRDKCGQLWCSVCQGWMNAK